jgi:D-sedoheptulose 7-phosphate isomerase
MAAADLIERAMLERNRVSSAFFGEKAEPLALACREMAARFAKGGRLLAFGRAQCATDAQHVSVEFVHPVIVGKRALPALDLSPLFESWLPAIVTCNDIVMGFGPAHGDPCVDRSLAVARSRGAQTFALPGRGGDFSMDGIDDPFIHQEIVEMLYHVLWESVHVFFEHGADSHDAGAGAFLYPFLGRTAQDTNALVGDVAASIQSKVEYAARLREQTALEQGDALLAAADAMAERRQRGGRLLLFGNGGSATDANDWALDAVAPPKGGGSFPAISLSMEAAVLGAIANDIGADAMFLRQLIAHARSQDIAVGLSTSGSANVAIALQEARRRGLLTVALLGYEGGEVVRQSAADFNIVVRSEAIPRIQEVHASIYHVILDLIQSRAV